MLSSIRRSDRRAFCVLVLFLPGLIASSALAQNARNLSSTHHRKTAHMMTVTLAGKILLENGQPPQDLIQVEFVCNGRITQQTLTTSDGSFAFDVGGPRNDDWLDPGVGGSNNGALESVVKVADPGGRVNLDEVPSMGHGQVSLAGCEVRAAPRPGLSSEVIQLRTRSAFDNPEIGIIVLRSLADPGATRVSLSTLRAPKEARKAFEKATRELASEKPNTNKISKELQRALQKYPEFSAAWDMLGRVQMSRGDKKAARESFERAIAEEPKFIEPYLAMAQIAVEESDWEETLKWASRILELDEALSQALMWHGLSSFYLERYGPAEESLSRLYHTAGNDREYPFGLLPLGVIHAMQGEIPDAASEFRLYLDLMPAERVPDAQRKELERQIATWKSQGLVPGPE